MADLQLSAMPAEQKIDHFLAEIRALPKFTQANAGSLETMGDMLRHLCAGFDETSSEALEIISRPEPLENRLEALSPLITDAAVCRSYVLAKGRTH